MPASRGVSVGCRFFVLKKHKTQVKKRNGPFGITQSYVTKLAWNKPIRERDEQLACCMSTFLQPLFCFVFSINEVIVLDYIV